MYPNEEPVDTKTKEEEQVIDAPLATISEVFSFAESFKTKLYLALGLFWAMVAGLAVPAPLIIYSKAMGDISAIDQEGLKPVVEIVYYMMVLGVISFVSVTLESTSCFDDDCHDFVVLVVKYLWILTFESFIRP